MQYLSKFLKPYRLHFIIGPACKLFEAILELLVPIFMADIINHGIIAGNRDKEYIYRTGGWMVLIVTIGLISALVCQYSASLASQGVGTSLRSALFEKVNHLPLHTIEQLGTSTLITRITNDVNQIQLAVAMTIRLVIRAPFVCIGSAVAAAMLNLKLSLVIFLSIPVLGVIVFFVFHSASPLYVKVQQKLDRLSVVTSENISGVRVIRAFAKNKAEKERFCQANDAVTRAVIRVNRISGLVNPLTTMLMNLAIVAVLYISGLLVQSNSLLPGSVLAFINYINNILTTLLVLANLVTIFTKANASLQRVNEVFDLDEESSAATQTNQSNHEDTATPLLVFDHVSFSYYGSSAEMELSDISFSMQPGETIGIIGGTGSGKSTLISLIPLFYPVSSGQIFFKGKPLAAYPLEELRAQIAIAPQKADLFSGSVSENLRWGNPHADLPMLEKALDTAQATDFVAAMPDGMEAQIERGGRNLSGGQRQRLNIARALVKDAELLILDDSFSALDYLTERRLKNALRENYQLSAIIISQRVSSIRNADRILVLDDGKMQGFGTHEELLQKSAVYQEIVRSQTAEEVKGA